LSQATNIIAFPVEQHLCTGIVWFKGDEGNVKYRMTVTAARVVVITFVLLRSSGYPDSSQPGPQ